MMLRLTTNSRLFVRQPEIQIVFVEECTLCVIIAAIELLSGNEIGLIGHEVKCTILRSENAMKRSLLGIVSI